MSASVYPASAEDAAAAGFAPALAGFVAWAAKAPAAVAMASARTDRAMRVRLNITCLPETA